MGKKKNSKYQAQRAMWAGAVATLVGLLVLPLAVKNMPLTYSADSGVVGDTIGGIAGPILNFTGLIIVYYSLREQFKANRQQARQIKREVNRARNERYFDLAFRLVEKLDAATEKRLEMFKEVAAFCFKQQNPKEYIPSKTGQGWELLGTTELNGYWWGFHDLNEYFTLIKGQLEGNELNGEQKLVLINLVDVTYGRELKGSRVRFQQVFKNGFERDDTQQDARPDFLKHIDDRLAEIYLLQEDAKNQASQERIPYVKVTKNQHAI